MSLNSLRAYLAKNKQTQPFYASASALAEQHKIDTKSVTRALREAGYERTANGWSLLTSELTLNKFDGLTILIPSTVVATVPLTSSQEFIDLLNEFIQAKEFVKAGMLLITRSYQLTGAGHPLIMEARTPSANVKVPYFDVPKDDSSDPSDDSSDFDASDPDNT